MDNAESIKKAREVAWSKNPKIKCRFCGEERREAYMIRHEESCFLNPKNLVMCVSCGTPVKKNYKGSKTCSYACSNTYYRSGTSHWNWKEDSYRTTCFLHHEKKCVVCNEENIVEVHHLDGDPTNNNPNNLIPLCPTHHNYWHSRYKSLIENTVREYVNRFLSRV